MRENYFGTFTTSGKRVLVRVFASSLILLDTFKHMQN